MRLRKLHEGYDPTDRRAAMNLVQQLAAEGEIATGLLFADPHASDLHAALNTVHQPLNTLRAHELCPGSDVLTKINASLR
jgi:2-oxoglutarate ferredoxin oxidoreductase subunit beta